MKTFYIAMTALSLSNFNSQNNIFAKSKIYRPEALESRSLLGMRQTAQTLYF